jgi:hypothetical protein
MHTLITHVVYQHLPHGEAYKYITPICSSEELIAQGSYFLGYDGSRTLRAKDLTNGEDGNYFKFETPIPIVKENHLFINRFGEIFYGSGYQKNQW